MDSAGIYLIPPDSSRQNMPIWPLSHQESLGDKSAGIQWIPVEYSRTRGAVYSPRYYGYITELRITNRCVSMYLSRYLCFQETNVLISHIFKRSSQFCIFWTLSSLTHNLMEDNHSCDLMPQSLTDGLFL